MVGRKSARRVEVEAPPLADAQTILAAMVSSGQSKVFLVDVGPNNEFLHVAMDGLPSMTERQGSGGEHRSQPHGRTPEECFGPEDGTAARARYRDCIAADGPIVYEEMLRVGSDERWWQTRLTPI